MSSEWCPRVEKWTVQRVVPAPEGKRHDRIEYLHFGATIIPNDTGFAVVPARYHWASKRDGRLKFTRQTQAKIAIEMAEAQGLDCTGAVPEPHNARQAAQSEREPDPPPDPAKLAQQRKEAAIASADRPPPKTEPGDVKVNPEYL